MENRKREGSGRKVPPTSPPPPPPPTSPPPPPPASSPPPPPTTRSSPRTASPVRPPMRSSPRTTSPARPPNQSSPGTASPSSRTASPARPPVAPKPHGSPAVVRAKPPMPPCKPSPPSGKKGISPSGKPPLPATRPITRQKSERKPPPMSAPPPPPASARPELMKQGSSFTTEDMDIFGKKRRGSSSDNSPNLSSIRRTRKSGNEEISHEKREKRRSKSVGSFARIGTKPPIVGPKPKVPLKPKFTDSLTSGKGLPEVKQVDNREKASFNVMNKAVSLDLPSSTKFHVPLAQQKQVSLDSDRPLGQGDCHKKSKGDLHPTKIADTHLSVKEPDSPSHTEIDRVKTPPAKGAKGNNHRKNVKTTKKPKDPQRKHSLSDRLKEGKAAVASKIRRTISRSGADTKDVDVVQHRQNVGNATFYDSGEEEGSANTENAPKSDSVFADSTSNSLPGNINKKRDASKDSKKTVVQNIIDTQTKDTVSDLPVISKNGAKENLDSTMNAESSSAQPIDDDVGDSSELYGDVVVTGEKGTYENLNVEHGPIRGERKLVPVHAVEIEPDETNNPIGPSEDYLPMRVSGTDDYADMNQSDSGNHDNTPDDNPYDNVQFDTIMVENSLYGKKTNSMCEAIDYHKGRELRNLSRQSRFRTAKRQKQVLLDDDKFEPATDQQVEEDLNFSESDSDFYFSDDDSDSDLEGEPIIQRASQITQASAIVEESQADRLHRISKELLTTEKAYVKRLHLVDQVFHFRVVLENRAHTMFPDDVIPQMFSNVKSIYQFHNDFLLPPLETRLEKWEETPKIGDLMKKFAPFFKLYTEYVKNFDNAMNVISAWTLKSPRFAGIIDAIQATEECGHLTLQHHMLEPIQRVPRYEMLLKDYLKHLPDDSDDKEDAEAALKLVTTAAAHSNDAMKKIEKFKQLLDLQEKVGQDVDLIGPSTEILKEGALIKISARNGQHYDRYLILFNNFLLVCQNVSIGIKQSYRIKANMPLDGMQVLEGNDFMTPNTFSVKTKKKIIELHASSMEEKVEWQVALLNAVADYTNKKMTRNITDLKEFGDNELGRRAPTWVKDQETSMCMICSLNFSILLRRHHCRACGIVVCGRCSRNKIALQYADFKLGRVCDICYEVLAYRAENQVQPESDSPEDEGGGKKQVPPRPPPPTNISIRAPSIKKVLKVKASDPCIISEYLNVSNDKRNWQLRFVTIHDSFVMYSFKAHQDVVAMTSLPLLSYKVTTDDTIPERSFVFTLHHKGEKKLYYFQAESDCVRKQWVTVLESVVEAEFPPNMTVSKPAISS